MNGPKRSASSKYWLQPEEHQADVPDRSGIHRLIGGVIGNILSFLMSFVINILTGNGAAMGIDGNISYIPWCW